ncbi:MAG: hypothetical protein SH817_00965 [Leptospira sp.]|nr:hypothetical protein [Leptospira sp.]
MSEIIDILSAINIPIQDAILLEKALDKKYVALHGFPPIEWDKAIMIPMQIEQIKSSERIESLRVQMDSRFREVENRLDTMNEKMDSRFREVENRLDTMNEKMDARFSAYDLKFAAIDDKFRILMWMNGILMAMAFAIFSKTFLT